MSRGNVTYRQLHGNRRGHGRPVQQILGDHQKLTSVRPVARGQLRPGTVVWAHIPFAEIDTEKTRPAIVESVAGRNVTLLPASSASSRLRFPDQYVELGDLRSAGLRRPTGVRRRRVTVDLIEIVSIAGCVSERDRNRLLEPSEDSCPAASDAA